MNKEAEKNNDVIQIHPDTKATLQIINKALEELSTKRQLVVRAYLSALNVNGNYQLSEDMSCFRKIETKEK